MFQEKFWGVFPALDHKVCIASSVIKTRVVRLPFGAWESLRSRCTRVLTAVTSVHNWMQPSPWSLHLFIFGSGCIGPGQASHPSCLLLLFILRFLYGCCGAQMLFQAGVWADPTWWLCFVVRKSPELSLQWRFSFVPVTAPYMRQFQKSQSVVVTTINREDGAVTLWNVEKCVVQMKWQKT